MEFTSEALVLNWEWLKAVGVVLAIAGIVIFALAKLVIMMHSQDRFGVIRYHLFMRRSRKRQPFARVDRLVSSTVDLLLTPGEHVLRRDVLATGNGSRKTSS